MMRYVLGFVAALAMAVPSVAQDAGPKPSMQDDLDCALFTAMVLGDFEEGEDPEAESGVLAGLTYFVGRWEAAGGTNLKQALIDRIETMSDLEFESLGDKCGDRMEELGGKMEEAGEALIALGEEEEAEAN